MNLFANQGRKGNPAVWHALGMSRSAPRREIAEPGWQQRKAMLHDFERGTGPISEIKD